MKKIFFLALAFFSACQTVQKKSDILTCQQQKPCPPCAACPEIKDIKPAVSILKLEKKELPFFKDDGERKSFLKAAELNKKYINGLPKKELAYSFGERKITTELLSKTNDKIIEILSSEKTFDAINAQIAEEFEIYELRPSTKEVIFSSYYEPMIEASLEKTKEYKYPIYAKPDDLISVNLEDFNEKFKGEKISGRIENGKLVTYYNRDEIDYQEKLKNKKLELAYLKSMADVLDLHIQGSGILKLPDGKFIKAKFAATNSLKFKGWMTALLEMNLMTRAELNADSAKAFIDSNPQLERTVMTQNKRYTFFRLEQNADIETGPEGTYGLPLVPQRSIAIDNALIPFGTLAFMNTNLPDVSEAGVLLGKKQDFRFVFCHDTGGAIKNARVDFFSGNGVKAKKFAFSLWDPGKLYLLILKGN